MIGSITRVCTIALSLVVALPIAASAQSPAGGMIARVEQELRKFDPAAVAAAREQLDMIDNAETREAKKSSLNGFREALINGLKADGSAVSSEVADEFMEEFLKISVVEHADAHRNVILLSMLESFTKDEIVAMADFYKSGIGLSVAKKLPAYSIRMGAMLSQLSAQLLPLAMQTARERLRQRGKLL